MTPFPIGVLAVLTWHPRLSPFWSGLLIAVLVLAGYLIYGRLRTRMSPRRAAVLIVPKAVVLLLLLIALLDPAWVASQRKMLESRMLVLRDVSPSMQVRDDGRMSRAERADAAIRKLEAELPEGSSLEVIDFASDLITNDEEAAEGTDIGGSLFELAERSDLSSYSAVVLVTDGGDEPVDSARLPPVPLDVVGVGLDPSVWDDLSVSDVQCPASVEKNVQFEIQADVVARTGYAFDFAQRLAVLRIRLERKVEGQWKALEERRINLSHGRTRVHFTQSCEDPGVQLYRVSLVPVEGEMTELNNQRTLAINVRERTVHVLFFSRELGAGFKMRRSELATDPGITFTALFRTIGQRYTVQGERLPGDEEIEAGFPADAGVLKLFDCVIVGSFPYDTWSSEQVQALVRYVDEGGAVIFLGGDESFGEGGYAGTPLAALLPWQINETTEEPARGRFPVSLPATSADYPIVAGLRELMTVGEPPAIESVNTLGPLKAGAIALMNAGLAGRVVPFVALQRYGKGRVLAIGSNTFWKWARQGRERKKAYGVLWRQAVRQLAGRQEGERYLSIVWNKESYRPGERAAAEVTLAGSDHAGVRMAAKLGQGEETRTFPVEPVAGQPSLFVVNLDFGKRGSYIFELTAYRDDELLESYEKTFQVGPVLDEGSRLEIDNTFLASLAARGSGIYVRAHEIDKLIDHLRNRNFQRLVMTESSFIYDRLWFVVLFVGLLIGEWTLRRRMNLF